MNESASSSHDRVEALEVEIKQLKESIDRRDELAAAELQSFRLEIAELEKLLTDAS